MDELSETVPLSESEIIQVEPPEPEIIASGIVESMLGKGGASVVYEIWNPHLEVFRAVKLWRLVQSEKTIKRFGQEIKITAKLKHPNIVEIYSAGKWNGLPYMEMEKIGGPDLKKLIKSSGAFPEIIVNAIALCICRAFIYAHNHLYTLSGVTCRGVVHCDIKPANIMISKSGVVKLMDFGIALPSNDTGSTANGSVTGSLQYMAPEQLESKLIDPRSDLYSLGVLLYEMYSGVKAFPADSLEELIQKRNSNDFLPLDSLGIKISLKARNIVGKLMQINPDDRFQSADELMKELQKIYQKSTDLQPQIVISSFLEGDELEFKKGKNIRKPLISALSTLCILLITAYMVVSRINSKSSFTVKVAQPAPVSSVVDSKPLQKPLEVVPSHEASGSSIVPIKTPVPRKAKSQIKKINKPVSPVSKSPKTESAAAVESIAKTVAEKKQITPTPESVLDEISSWVKNGNLASAERMLHENPLNDGEYYILSAEILLKRNRLSTAMLEAQKALRIPASRISSGELRNRFLYLKACILSAGYDRSPQEQSGQDAMEAWFEVKYTNRSNTSHPYYTKADMEIRRISASIQ